MFPSGELCTTTERVIPVFTGVSTLVDLDHKCFCLKYEKKYQLSYKTIFILDYYDTSINYKEKLK